MLGRKLEKTINSFFKFIQPTYVLGALIFIALPSIIEANTIYEAESSSKFVRGLPMRMSGVENQHLNTSWLRGQFDSVDKVCENFSEFGTGFYKHGIPFSAGSQPMRYYPRQTSSDKAEEPQILSAEADSEYFHAVLFNVFTWIVLLLLYMGVHNVELRGCALLRSLA
jgi:hypothetical protein